jgi:hypothetical protein
MCFKKFSKRKKIFFGVIIGLIVIVIGSLTLAETGHFPSLAKALNISASTTTVSCYVVNGAKNEDGSSSIYNDTYNQIGQKTEQGQPIYLGQTHNFPMYEGIYSPNYKGIPNTTNAENWYIVSGSPAMSVYESYNDNPLGMWNIYNGRVIGTPPTSVTIGTGNTCQQTTTQTFTITGNVKNLSNQNISGVGVWVSPNSGTNFYQFATTDTNGNYTANGITFKSGQGTNEFQISFRQSGYKDYVVLLGNYVQGGLQIGQNYQVNIVSPQIKTTTPTPTPPTISCKVNVTPNIGKTAYNGLYADPSNQLLGGIPVYTKGIYTLQYDSYNKLWNLSYPGSIDDYVLYDGTGQTTIPGNLYPGQGTKWIARYVGPSAGTDTKTTVTCSSSATPPSAAGYFSITGQLTAKLKLEKLNIGIPFVHPTIVTPWSQVSNADVFLENANTHTQIIPSVQTDSSGNFQMSKIPATKSFSDYIIVFSVHNNPQDTSKNTKILVHITNDFPKINKTVSIPFKWISQLFGGGTSSDLSLFPTTGTGTPANTNYPNIDGKWQGTISGLGI